MKKLNHKQQEEILRLKDFTSFILKFIESEAENAGEIKSAGADQVFAGFKAAIESTYINGDIKGMRILESDIAAWARGLPPTCCLELNTLLESKFSRNLTNFKTIRKLQALIDKGVLKNTTEYKLAFDFLEEHNTGLHSTQTIDVSKLEELVNAYQARTGTF